MPGIERKPTTLAANRVAVASKSRPRRCPSRQAGRTSPPQSRLVNEQNAGRRSTIRNS
jgi:hypothetical protein